MKCTGCGASLPPGANFCPGCGRSATASAGATNDPGLLERLIPRQYLDQLVATRGRPSGERRVVTIVFFDVTGSTAMAENLDPEDVMEIMNGAFEVLIEPVYRYEGTLARLMGDAVLAFFGAPIAHEDDAARACQAALDVLQRARDYAMRLERERGIRGFDVRVGINTGLVAVGEVGADLRVEYTAMGDAVNLAARMESAAEPGTALITQETRELVAHLFETEDLGEIQVKGKADRVHVYRLLRPRSTGAVRNDASPGTTMFGHEKELAELCGVLRSLGDGRGASVDIVADAGLGKSRLIAEARRRGASSAIGPSATGQSAVWIEGRCMPYATDIGYWIARDMLCGLVGIDSRHGPGEAAAALLDSLTRALGHATDSAITLSPEDAYPVLAHLLGLPLEQSARESIVRLSEADRRERLCMVYRETVRACAARAPLVMVWDDLQWADSESLEIVASLRGLCDVAPLAVVCSYRPGTDPGQDGEIAEGESAIRIAPLDAETSARMMESLLGDLPIPRALIDEVIAGAEGNPFFLEQVARALIEAADMVDSGWGLRTLEVPTTLQGAIMARIDGLQPEEKNTLQHASVVGRQFSRAVLSDVVGTDTDSAALDSSLCELTRREFLQARPGEGARRGDDEYAFTQTMTAEVAYNSMLKSRRTELHRRAGYAIEALFLEQHDELSPILAHHFDAAGEAGKAVEHTVRAARRARSLSSNREAIRRYRRALQLIRESGSDVGDAASIHEELGDINVIVGNYAAAVEAYDHAALISEPSRRVTLDRKKGQLFQKWGKHDEAVACFESAESGLGKPLDTIEAAHIYSGLGMARCHRGQLDEAVSLATRALEMMAESDNRRGLAQASNNLGIVHARREAWDDAIECHRRARSIWEDLGDDYGLAASYNNIGLAHHGRRELDDAIDAFERSLALFEKVGNRHGLACAYDNLGQVYMDREDHDRAMCNLKKAVTIMADIAVDKSEMLPEMWQIEAW